MMGAGPAMMAPPAPVAPQGVTAPAAALLPGMADLAQAQSAQLMAMQDEMNKQIMMLIASLPTPNPAGEAAVSTPMSPMMSGSGSAAPAMPMSGDSGAY